MKKDLMDRLDANHKPEEMKMMSSTLHFWRAILSYLGMFGVRIRIDKDVAIHAFMNRTMKPITNSHT